MLLQIRSCIRRVLAGRVDRRLESKVIANDGGFVLMLEMKVKNIPKVTFYVVISTSCNDSQYTYMDSSTYTVMSGNNLNKWFIIPRLGGGPAKSRIRCCSISPSSLTSGPCGIRKVVKDSKL